MILCSLGDFTKENKLEERITFLAVHSIKYDVLFVITKRDSTEQTVSHFAKNQMIFVYRCF